jgi:hypothetical protein
VTENYAGTTTFDNSTGDISNVSYYNESAQLSTGFTLNANQTYYLGIFSFNSTDSTTDEWSWMSGTGGDGVSSQFQNYDGTNTQVNLDRTFSLSGTVPEPSSLILTAIGAVVLGAYSRKPSTANQSQSISRTA